MKCDCGVENHGSGMNSIQLNDGYADKEFRDRLQEFADEWLCQVNLGKECDKVKELESTITLLRTELELLRSER